MAGEAIGAVLEVGRREDEHLSVERSAVDLATELDGMHAEQLVLLLDRPLHQPSAPQIELVGGAVASGAELSLVSHVDLIFFYIKMFST